jgi:hypothetical protein
LVRCGNSTNCFCCCCCCSDAEWFLLSAIMMQSYGWNYWLLIGWDANGGRSRSYVIWLIWHGPAMWWSNKICAGSLYEFCELFSFLTWCKLWVAEKTKANQVTKTDATRRREPTKHLVSYRVTKTWMSRHLPGSLVFEVTSHWHIQSCYICRTYKSRYHLVPVTVPVPVVQQYCLMYDVIQLSSVRRWDFRITLPLDETKANDDGF